MSDDGATIWVATDSGGFLLGPDGFPTDAITDPGAILALTSP